jgi:DNA helicase-2/ATP-dependent DNA helicase PcrA
MYEMTQRTLLGLNHAVNSPYFTRVDFIPEGKEKQTHYIGKWGVLDPKTRTPIIVDWRSDIANLYYTHQVGSAEYQAPYQVISGEMTLKRMFFFKSGILKTIIESDIISQGEYLNDVLSDHADSKLKDVVTTIQAEQNAVLRCSPRVPTIVQGVAGAGKTTIALHRITWLLYTFRDTMSPSNLMIIAPNPLFLDYISAVLPDLGVESAIQETFYGLAQKLCGKSIPKLDDNASLIKLLSPETSDEEKQNIRNASSFKGSLMYKKCLESFIEGLPEKLFPKQDFTLGGHTVAERSRLLDIYEDELSPFPLKPRIKELKKRLKEMADNAETKLINFVESEARKRANYLREVVKHNDSLRMEKMKALYANRDAKIDEIKNGRKNMVENYLKQFGDIRLMQLYKEFVSIQPQFTLPHGVSIDTWKNVCEYTQGFLKNKRIESLDIPALIILQKALLGHKSSLDIHHSVLDEAQDFSPFMFDILKSLTVNEAFTIVGDLAQGIYSYRGVTDWGDMKKDVFEHGSQFYELITSYRNTIEIMEFAEHVASRYASDTRKGAKPVLRHGKKPETIHSNNVVNDIIGRISDMQKAGHKSIAIVEKLPSDCAKLHKSLQKSIPDIHLLHDSDTRYEAGVMVVPAHLCKGLEFDCVIVTNADENNFPDDELHANLLYVVLTRPLHELVLFHENALSPLLV